MNLNAYDTITQKIDKTKTWINIENQQLFSREIPYRKYNTVSKRYNKEDNTYEYYIIMLDDYPLDRPYTKTKKDNYGRIKLYLRSIWNECFSPYFEKDTNIDITHIEHTDDGDIYKINI